MTADGLSVTSSERMSADGVWWRDDSGNLLRVSGRTADICSLDVKPTLSAFNGADDMSSAVIRSHPPFEGRRRREGDGNVEVQGTHGQKGLSRVEGMGLGIRRFGDVRAQISQNMCEERGRNRPFETSGKIIHTIPNLARDRRSRSRETGREACVEAKDPSCRGCGAYSGLRGQVPSRTPQPIGSKSPVIW
jgi:hypothetical protein